MPDPKLRVLMLTPDGEYLDRRIAQEAATLARHGQLVDIFPVYRSLRTLPGELAPGVAMLAGPETTERRRSVLYRMARWIYRSMKRQSRLHRVSSAVYRAGATTQRFLWDQAVELDSVNETALRLGPAYDVVFAHDIPVLPLASRLKDAWAAALICDLHEIYPEQDELGSRAKDYWRKVESDYLPRADGILCVNPSVEEYVRRRYSVSARIGVVYNSVPYHARPSANGTELHRLFDIADDKHVLVYAGTLRSDANLELLVSGFLEAAVSGWVLAFLASGPLETELSDLVSSMSATDRVVLGKRVPQPDLIRVLSSADAAVLPYPAVGYNVIATPNKLFEYIQARLPIATTRLPQVERILQANRNGVFVDFSSQTALAADLSEFMTRSALTITPAELDAAARNVCWEHDEATLRDVFEHAIEVSADAQAQVTNSQEGAR